MAETPGICLQTTHCEMARSGRSVTIPLGSAFVCPECGRGLVPPVQASEPAVPRSLPLAVPVALAGAGLLLLGGAMFLGRELGAAGGPPAPAVLASVTPPPPTTALPRAAATLPQQVTAPISPQAGVDAPTQVATVTPPQVAAVAPPQAGAGAPSPAAEPAPPPALQPQAVHEPAPPAPSPAGLATQAAPANALAPATVPAATPVAVAAAAPSVAAATRPAVVAAVPPQLTPPVLQEASRAAALPAPAAVMPLPPDQPFSAVPVSGGAPPYPAELAADGRTGRVAITCQIQTDGTPASCRAAASKGGPAFAASALTWLAHAHVRYRPIILHGRPAAGPRSWTVAIEEPAAALAEARRKQGAAAGQLAELKPPPAASEPAPPSQALAVQPAIARVAAPPASPAEADRPFSTRVVAGGTPAFPATYEESRPGTVTVSCTITPSGSPAGCRVVSTRGGKAFGKSVEDWLGSGRVRFRPVTVQGQPVSREESWTIVFNQSTASDGN